MATLFYGQEAYADDRLVVDLRDAKLVLAELTAIGVPWQVSDSSEPLGLARLVPAAQGSFLSGLSEDERARLVERTQSAKARHDQSADGEPPQLDLVLRALRERFAERFDGWSPTMGKDRVVDTVESSPHIGGDGDPEPLPDGETFRLPPRTAATGHRVRVGILDTKLFPHPDLTGRYVVESDALLALPAAPKSPTGHAVFLAGLVLQKAPNADLVIRSALGDLGSASSWDTANKMVEFRNDDVAVLNMSFSCITSDREPPLVLARAVERLSSAIVLVAAAGNHGQPTDPQRQLKITATTPAWPAAFDDVVAVGADRVPGQLAAFSPRVPWTALVATGEGVPSLFLPGEVEIVRRGPLGGPEPHGVAKFGAGYATWNGTSAAAAKISGAIAALAAGERISEREALNRLLTPPSHPTSLYIDITKDIRPFKI